ncbi:MAG: phosphate/phosphite/phosphonate ABC transporter substrate-binding protein [Pseudomonadota bacterium]
MRRALAISLVSLLIVAFTQTSCDFRRGEPGTKSNPIRLFFMPLKGGDAFAKNAPIIQKFLEQDTGLAIKPIAAPDFLTIVKAFGNRQADVAFTNTLGYLMAHDLAKAEPRLLLVYGDVYRAYRGEIISVVGGPINSPEDISGKSIAFSDPFSASGYLYALKFLNDRSIKPSKIIFAGGHRDAVEMLYKGQVDAAATYHERPSPSGQELDARAELLIQHPDIMSKLKVVALTDEIPSGPVAFRHDLPQQVKAKLVAGLVEFSRTQEGRRVLGDLYNATGFAFADEADYDGVRGVLKKLGKSVAEVVPGGITYYNTNISPLLSN